MKFFVIKVKDSPVAVVFHNYQDGTFYCRSKKESFLRAFNAICIKADIKFVKEGDLLRSVYCSPKDYDWMNSLLDQLCTDYWNIGEIGEFFGDEANIDNILRKYLI